MRPDCWDADHSGEKKTNPVQSLAEKFKMYRFLIPTKNNNNNKAKFPH